MRLIAFITDAATVREILTNLGEASSPPRLGPARGPRCGRWPMPRRATPKLSR